MKRRTCCFSGYRPEKMPPDLRPGTAAFAQMIQALRRECLRAAEDGYTVFLSGMSRGFDLWAADVVLELQKCGLPVELWAAIAFHGMEQYWEPTWQESYCRALYGSRHTFCCFDQYQSGCYSIRDRLLVDRASRMICYYDGISGGTEFTVNYARRSGLDIRNLAEETKYTCRIPEYFE